MHKKFTIIPAIGSGFLVISLINGECLGWFKTHHAANKARRLALLTHGE